MMSVTVCIRAGRYVLTHACWSRRCSSAFMSFLSFATCVRNCFICSWSPRGFFMSSPRASICLFSLNYLIPLEVDCSFDLLAVRARVHPTRATFLRASARHVGFLRLRQI